jgi:DNA-binding SARP family transcriptional activator
MGVHRHGDALLPDPRRRERSAPATGPLPTDRSVVPAKVRVPATDALPRERLEGRLAELWSHRLGLVVAPAGSGKTTLLARFAASAGVPVAWYRAESWDRDEVSLVRHLHAALGRAMPGLTNGWQRVEDAAEALEAWDGGRALLVVDDLHALEGTPAEAALARFVEYAPPWLAILAGSRIVPEVNVSRLRVSGELLEIDADDLRFRSWEVERLFRDFYGETIPPGDIATLARRTEGWAAGLQLFHLATRGKTAEERRRILGVAAASGRLVREYLARNVLAELPASLREFLLETFVLGRLTGDLCDRLRGATGSAVLLEELARRQIFTVTVDPDDGSYRYHEVLRAHLDRMLVDLAGEAGARARHARAAELLEADGALAEALAAYCRSEDWPAVERMLGRQGERLVGESSAWLDLLPPALARHDPWLTLATARQARAEGRWSAALDAYLRSENGFGAAATSAVVRRERLGLTAWIDPTAHVPADWAGVLRAGLTREPMLAAREASRLDDGPVAFVRGTLALAAGEVAQAQRDLESATADATIGPALAAAATILSGVAALLAGDSAGAGQIEMGVEAADRAGQSWLADRGRAAARLLGGRTTFGAGNGSATRSDAAGATADDRWGAAIDLLLEAWAQVDGPAGRLESAEEAATSFRLLGSAVLESWARSLGALALADVDADEAREVALSAETAARSAGAPGARLLAFVALGRVDPTRSGELELLAEAARRETGLELPPRPRGARDGRLDRDIRPEDGAADRFEIRTFGRFGISAGSTSLQLGQVRPRARALLRLLALHSGTPVHREVICDALWPDVDGPTGARSLHVAISSLRGQLVEQLGAATGQLIVRDGDAYRLAVPDEAVDLRRFERAIADGRAARSRGERASDSYRVALALHAGELLSEDGPAEWAVERRERCRAQAVEAAQAIAQEALIDGELDVAVDACRAGLELDRYHDPLWRSLIQARDRAGDPGAASRDRRDYAAVLADLGVGEVAAIGQS